VTRPLALLAPLLLLLLTACASDRYSVASSTGAGDRSEVEVLGGRPQVSMENEGPGELRVQLVDAEDGRHEEVLAQGERTEELVLSGPVLVAVEPTGELRATWRLLALRATGLRVDVLVERSD
jgi:hypothetical protein